MQLPLDQWSIWEKKMVPIDLGQLQTTLVEKFSGNSGFSSRMKVFAIKLDTKSFKTIG
jgi:hypothetical protein